MSDSGINTGVNIHTVECRSCEHKFYVDLPTEDCTEQTECVECGVLLERTYSFEEPEGEDWIEVKIEINEVTDE